MRCMLSFVLSAALLLAPLFSTSQTEPQEPPPQEVSVSAPSVVLMEASTGQIVYDKDPDTLRHPASITKIMTMILIFDALEAGKIYLEDTVTVSEYAASMGGSQVYLEAFEQQTVETMLKCIAVASANDACVAYRHRNHVKMHLSSQR